MVSDKADGPAENVDGTGLDSVRRAQAGDVNAFRLLYNEHAGRNVALCLRLVGGDTNDATELLQDVFVRAWRKLDTFAVSRRFRLGFIEWTVNTMLENARG